MNARTLALAALALLAAPALRAQDHNARDDKKALELARKDGDFRHLTDDEKKKVVDAIAIQIHGRRRKARQAMIITRKGTDVAELEKQAAKISSYELVSATQDKEPVAAPPKTTVETHEVQTPDFGKLFADNDWELLEGSPDAEALRKQTDAVIDMIKKTDGRLVSVHVESSASALQNTGKAAKMPHLELSRRRAESAADFVTKELAAHGIALDDEQVTLDFAGGNGNGTSGPSSPFPCTGDPKLCAQGSCLAPQDLVDAIKKGAPDAETRKKIAAVYDPFKFVDVSFVVANQTETRDPGAAQPGAAHAVLVHVGYKEKPEFHWPRISIRLPKLGNPRKHWGDTSCPRF